MHETLVELQAQLETTIERLKAVVTDDRPFSIAHNNWQFPGLTRDELIAEARDLIQLIEDRGGEDLGENEAQIINYVKRINHLHTQTVANMWTHPAQSVPAYLFTLQGLRKALASALTRDMQAETSANLRKLSAQVRSIESRIKGVEPRTASLETMVERIEDAYQAADKLPSDLESLQEAREAIGKLARKATTDCGDIETLRTSAGELEKQILQARTEADNVLQKCESAYSAATSVGLAAAFTERSSALSRSMWFWIAGLISALAVGGIFGSLQLRTLTESFNDPSAQLPIILLKLTITLLSVGAPVWFAWLSTKQIGQRFRLSEDYAFKASVSRAYEGYRREAARIDKDMEAKLLASALTRLDELPLRWVENESHGSPLHELANSAAVKQALKTIPGFAGQILELANKAVDGASSAIPGKKRKAESTRKQESPSDADSQ